jgi:lactoylglutathione lyase
MRKERRMRFCWVTIAVQDIEKSKRFYTDIVGLPIDRVMKPSETMELVFLGDETTKVELLYDANHKGRDFGKDISIGFEVEELEAFMDKLKKSGIGILSGPHQPGPRIRFIYVLDPDGVKVQFIENIR